MKVVKVLLILAGVCFLGIILLRIVFFGIPIPFPVNLSRVDRIELEESADKPSTEPRIFVIDDKEEIEDFMSHFKGIGWGIKATPSCPFGLPITFYEGRKVIKMDLGTDDCGLICYKNYYFFMNEEQVYKLQDKIRELGLDFDRIRW